jgi:hypothetical protein
MAVSSQPLVVRTKFIFSNKPPAFYFTKAPSFVLETPWVFGTSTIAQGDALRWRIYPFQGKE